MKYRLLVARPSLVLLLLVLVGSLLAPAYRVHAQKDTPPSKPTETGRGPKVETQGDGAKEDQGTEQHSSRTQAVGALGGTYDVGVIPATRACPVASEAIVINMDDEDHSNTNSHTGWNGAISSTNDTSLFFCRIDGQRLRALTAVFAATQHHYAVLKLGATCPNGSLDFWRYFDNEDDNNANSSSGNIAPNNVDRNTTLSFCLFRNNAVTMSNFPSLGFSYGVFAAPSFSRRLASGYFYTDDEDDANENGYSADPAWSADAQRIVSAGANTTLYLAQVR